MTDHTATIAALRNTIAELYTERDVARAERDEAVEANKHLKTNLRQVNNLLTESQVKTLASLNWPSGLSGPPQEEG